MTGSKCPSGHAVSKRASHSPPWRSPAWQSESPRIPAAGSPARGSAPVPVDAGRSGPPFHRRPELGVRRGKVAAVWAPDAGEETHIMASEPVGDDTEGDGSHGDMAAIR